MEKFLKLPEVVLRSITENLELRDAINILYGSRFLLKHLRASIITTKISSFHVLSKVLTLFPKSSVQLLNCFSPLTNLIDFGAHLTEIHIDNNHVSFSLPLNHMVRLRKLRCHQYNLFRILKPDQLPPNLAYLEIAASGMDFSMFEKLTDLRVRWQNVYYGPTGFPSTLTRLVILGNVLLPDSKISGLDGLRSVEFCNLDDFFTIFESPGCQLKLTDLGIKLPHRHYVEASKKLKFTENLNARILANLRSIESLTWQFAVIPLNFFDSMVCLKRIKILGFGEFVRGSFIEIPSVTEVEFDNVYHWQGIVKYFPNVRSLTLRLCEFENPLKKPLMDLEELEIMNCGVSDLGLKKWNCIMRSVYLRIIDCNIGPDVFEKITGESVTCNFGLCYASFGGVFQKMWGLRKLCLPDFSGFPITTFRQVPYVVGRCI